jgi:hypothetical protein
MLFFLHQVDSIVKRITHNKEVDRRWEEIRTTEIQCRAGPARQVAVFRAWEARNIQASFPFSMRRGDYSYLTAKYHAIMLADAPKELHNASKYPTLPQHRLNYGEVARPLQYEYPVWYFLMSPVDDAHVLQYLLKLGKPPYTRAATVLGFTTAQGPHCGGLFPSTVEEDYEGTNKSRGIAYLVKNELEEDRLRYFHTDLFKVVSDPHHEIDAQGLG